MEGPSDRDQPDPAQAGGVKARLRPVRAKGRKGQDMAPPVGRDSQIGAE
jgi:hypothetical protein